ncbi:MAG: hypothetical protein ACYCQJ_14865 [Nitrososphaerales archaeon]
MSVPTYRIVVSHGVNNSHAVDRSETWLIQRGPNFETEDDARMYILSENRRFLPQFLHEKVLHHELSMEEACTSPQYVRHQRAFLVKPPLECIKGQLRAEGIRVVNE